MSERICQFKLSSLLSYTIYFGASDYDLARATKILANSCNFFSLASLSLSISLNTCLCVDLILMVRFPFDKKESRIPKYLAASIFLAVIEALLLI